MVATIGWFTLTTVLVDSLKHPVLNPIPLLMAVQTAQIWKKNQNI